MKKVQSSFVVEYKSGRRKTDPKSSSIWGNLDLKSVTRDVQEEAIPFLAPGEDHGASDNEISLPKLALPGSLLTQSTQHPTTAAVTEETIVAHENDMTTSNDAPASAVGDLDPVKNERKPHAKKAPPETASAEDSAEPATALSTPVGKRGEQTRGRKPKSAEVGASLKRAPVKRAPKTVQAASETPIAAIDENEDLLQLEGENHRLRKLLAEKLRAENADLRKRLHLG